MLIKFTGKLRQLKTDCKNYLMYDHRGELTLNIKGREIIATFAEHTNDEILPRMCEILLGESVVNNLICTTSHIENIKEAV